jgi:xanthine dehydrogenase small subunit
VVLTGGGTDLYVQRPEQMAGSESRPLFYDDSLRGIIDTGEHIEIGASATVTDLLESPLMNEVFPDLYKHLKLVSSTPIRNMATLAGNFVNASPIGDMTVWFLALDAEIVLSSPPYKRGVAATSADAVVLSRRMKLRDLYKGYKQLAKREDEIITKIRFKKPGANFHFNFEKVCKRTYLDIATVNTAISIESEPPALADGLVRIHDAHVSAGGVSPIPLYLTKTSEFLRGKEISAETITAANEIMQSEIAPISDVRGTESYKRLLLRQLFQAHFIEMFGI